MAKLNPADFDAQLAVIASRKIIPLGGSITIKEIATKDGGRWYHVEARDSRAAVIGIGWVNVDASFHAVTELRHQLRRYMRYYNHRRLHSALDYQSPVDYERGAA